jgi:dienelactone hydrolase
VPADNLPRPVLRPGRPLQDLEAGKRWLLASPECTGRIGVIGFEPRSTADAWQRIETFFDRYLSG